jgi:hypothetical protein
MSRAMLEKAGWVRLGARKVGCFKLVNWYDPYTGNRYSQGRAIEVQKGRNRLRTQALRGRPEAASSPTGSSTP